MELPTRAVGRVPAERLEERIDQQRPGMTCADARLEWHFGDHPFMTQRFIDQFADDIRKAGLPD